MTAPRVRDMALLLPILLAGCNDGPDTDAAAPPAVVIQAAPQTKPLATRTAPVPGPLAPPTPENRPPLTEMAPKKPFTDPPLPPELLDDGGLIPLPSPPNRR